MTPLFVADIGNTRIKCGHYDGQTLRAATILDDPTAPPIEDWCEAYSLKTEDVLRCPWLVSAVNPKLRDPFIAGLRDIGFSVDLLDDYRQIPMEIDVQKPDRVGIDRLLSAFAIARRYAPGNAAVVIGVGTAVTVDLVDGSGVFRGGVIFPGFRLMARSLHEHTAQLPLVEEFDSTAAVPAKSTDLAIGAGVCAAISGGIDRVVEQYRSQHPTLKAYLTGGDANVLTTLTCKPNPADNLVLVGLVLAAKNRS